MTSILGSRPSRPIARRSAAPGWIRALVTGALLAFVFVGPVLAADIPRLQGPVTDLTGSLAGDEARVASAVQGTLDDHNVQVFVLFVETTGDLTAGDFASQTAAANSLGGNDALLLVAIDDRTDYIWVSDGLDQITDDELDAIIVDVLEPGLRSGDFASAAIEAVAGIGQAAASAAPTTAPITAVPGSPPPSGPGGGGTTADGGPGINFGVIAAFFLIGGGGFIVWRQWRLGKLSGGGSAPAGTSPTAAPVDAKALARQANALLIATDERIRDAGQETDFAEAQYGADAVVTFRAAVADARTDLDAAFTVRQRLDDDEPEDEPTRIAMLQEIVERTTKAQGRLDAETDRIRQLRDLERDAPNTLVELPGRIEVVEDRLDAVAPTMTSLQRYADPVWAPVRGNLEEARKGIAGARTAVTVGSAAAARNELPEVAVATRTALEGMTGAGALLDAIEVLATAVADAERRIPDELAAAERDLRDLATAMAGRAVDGSVDARRRGAETALEAARTAVAATPGDPVNALRLATEAHRIADEALVGARDAAVAADRLIAAAASTVRTAAFEVDRAAAFIASRRRGVGEVARTRLAEAQRHLAEANALLATDAAGAQSSGQRAQALAQEAYHAAQDDFSDWDQGGPGYGQRGGTSGGDQTAAVLGQILGGVIGGVLSGGGRSGGGGWGGSPWGGSGGGGGGGGWGGGGGFGSGGFGGGGGGGGGHGRGGRW